MPCEALGHIVLVVELGKLLPASGPLPYLSVNFLIFSDAFMGGLPPEYLPKLSLAVVAATVACRSLTFHFLTLVLGGDFYCTLVVDFCFTSAQQVANEPSM